MQLRRGILYTLDILIEIDLCDSFASIRNGMRSRFVFIISFLLIYAGYEC